MEASDNNSSSGLEWHCRIAALLIKTWPDQNPHVKHHIRGAIREASLSIKGKHGSALRTTDFFTPEAKDKLEKGEEQKIVREHVVPISVIVRMVSALESPTEKDIVEIVKQWTKIASITQEQDKRLREEKLSKSMPKDWDGRDMFARYKKANIPVPNL